MTRFNRQLSAAARQFDNSCDCCGTSHCTEQAKADYAAQLVRDDEVGALVDDLYAASNTVLVALNYYANGRAPDFATTTLMQRLRALVKSVEGA